jgi:hypothetical protein
MQKLQSSIYIYVERLTVSDLKFLQLIRFKGMYSFPR